MHRGRLFLLLATLCLVAPFVHAEDKPNIVLVFMDNFGWGEPGFNGGGIIRGAATPQIDSLADEGLRLTNFNVEVQCTPSRSALMTGRYAEVTMAEMLADAGYATGMFGKWHLGRTEGRFPTDQGFDEWYGVPNSTDESVYSSLQDFAESGLAETWVMDGKKGSAPKNVRPYRLDYRPLIDRDLTDKAISFMQRQAKADKPFFVYLPYTATHFPTMPHPDFVGKSGNGPWGDLLMQIDSYRPRVGEGYDLHLHGGQRPRSAERRRNVDDGRNSYTRFFRSVAFHAVYRLRGGAARAFCRPRPVAR
jgi:arylsulfatase